MTHFCMLFSRGARKCCFGALRRNDLKGRGCSGSIVRWLMWGRRRRPTDPCRRGCSGSIVRWLMWGMRYEVELQWINCSVVDVGFEVPQHRLIFGVLQ